MEWFSFIVSFTHWSSDYIANFKSFCVIPVDTGRKLNVHKKFRRRPGRLLNVLCTFNLRPVSTGILCIKFKENCTFW